MTKIKLTLEQQPLVIQGVAQCWRVAERELTHYGFGRRYRMLATNLPDYPTARKMFDQIKGVKL